MVTLHETARVPYRPAGHRVDQIRAYGEAHDHKAARLLRAGPSAALGRDGNRM